MEEQDKTLFAMDTWFSLTAYGENAGSALDAAEREVRRLESLFSVTDPDSELYALNHSGGLAVAVSGDMAQLLAFSLEMAEETDGRFDPTIYPLLTAWGFTTQEYRVPGQSEIDQLLTLTGYALIEQTEKNVEIPEGTQLDFGAVAKGYTGDRLAALMKEEYGISSALLNLGGNVQAIGRRPDGTPWRIGIRDPYGEDMLGVLEVEDAAVITSGGYERFFTGEEGKTYWHIIDPATGHPADSGLISVTVTGKEGAMCDALSTALFVMGVDGAADYWRTHSGFDMILVTEQDELYVTEGIAEQFDVASPQFSIKILNR